VPLRLWQAEPRLRLWRKYSSSYLDFESTIWIDAKIHHDRVSTMLGARHL
jgi:hypothetical protein